MHISEIADASLLDGGPVSREIDSSRLLIVVPTLNPGNLAAELVTTLRQQRVNFNNVMIIDSSSDDGSIALFRQAGCTVRIIERGAFDHGGTRNLGVDWAGDFDIVLFLTQDAMPSGHAMLNSILAPFADPRVALVYGRQLPRDRAGPIEAHARWFNYPGASLRRAMPQARSLGIKAVFNSNSFAAYRRHALLAVGGFPSHVIMGEDQVAAARLLQAGWTVVYQAAACVKHSHAYTVRQEMERYFDIGVFHRQARASLAPFGTAGSEGLRYVISELRHLLRTDPTRIPEALLRTAAKLVGYKLGGLHVLLPNGVNRHLAMNKSFFRAPPTPYRLAAGHNVMTFDVPNFEAECRRLMQLVAVDGHPDVLVGVRTGGMFVAEAMARAAGRPLAILPITCRRPSTVTKRRAVWLMTVIGRLPRGVLDRLRIVEHGMLARWRARTFAAPYDFDLGEMKALQGWLHKAGSRPYLVVVDDAVDSGATLCHVLSLLRRIAPIGASIRSAVITVTLPRPLVTADYALHHLQLCRFPWSHDA